MTPQELRDRLCCNAWDWNFATFCRRTGLSGHVAEQKWEEFKKASAALGSFDDGVLDSIFGGKDLAKAS